jgi:hypothetical protein
MELKSNNYIVDGYSENKYTVAVITGAFRSGKTVLGLELAKGKYVDHFEDDWISMILTISSGLGMIDSAFAKHFLRAYINEKINDSVLLRNANFRPGDQTSIWNLNNTEDIFHRLMEVKSRVDVSDFLASNNYLLLLNLPSILPFVNFLFDVYPGLKALHVVRNGISVAKEIEAKEWWSDESLRLRRISTIYKTVKLKGEIVNFPWWVRDDEEEFFYALDGFSRALYSWVINLDFNHNNDDNNYQNGYIKNVRFEDLVGNNLRKTFEEVCIYLSICDQLEIGESVRRLSNIQISVSDSAILKKVPYELRKRVIHWLEHYEYI